MCFFPHTGGEAHGHDHLEARRQRAVQRLLQGEAFTVVCLSEGVSRGWLYKWWVRHTRETATWFQDDSRRPHTQPGRTAAEIEEIVQLVRLELYNQAQFCGAQAIRWRLADLAVQPLPSIRTIGRILARHDLTHRRTGRYTRKGCPTRGSTLPARTMCTRATSWGRATSAEASGSTVSTAWT